VVPRNYLDNLTSALRTAFQKSLCGVYLTGSAAVGAYRPGGSDLDVLVAVEGASRAALEQVVASCAHDVLPCPAEKLELVVYEVDVLADPGARPRWSLNFDTGASTHQVDWDPDAQPSHWFVLDLAFARVHAEALVGPPAADLIAKPGDDAMRTAFDELVEWYERNEPQHAAVARERADHWRRTGTFMPKPGLPST
jgi:hypothetical protein